MAKNLVIVESPAKAKTIGSYLGGDYLVEASVGHIRDLLPNGKKLPEEQRKKWWSDYAVDVDNRFEPIYEVPSEKLAQVKRLKSAMKGIDTLVLATDEDREGESISWHLLQVLNPGKGVVVKRIAFHEITKEAILEALRNPRDVDAKLVEAQETRRILDRLYGYTLSPVLWATVTKNLSAGRVQSPAVKLVVERERQRRAFHSAVYWDLKADLKSDGVVFPAELKTIAGQRVANGSDFDDETGALKDGKALLIGPEQAASLALAIRDVRPWIVTSLSENEAFEKPGAPFMTTTLQQDANRKFGYGADRTMRIAQTLYEGVEIGGEQVGLITYMRTDSLTLSTSAVADIRRLISEDYADCLPAKPVVYTSKVRNAQEAHEAIRPTSAHRKPAAVAKHLNEDQRKIYELIWKRTIACQMKPARVMKTEVETSVESGASGTLTFRSSGKQILFDGFHRVYTEGSDNPEADIEGMERKLPRLHEGAEVEPVSVGAAEHATKPPARYTEATLIKKLEEQGIGRPSTYATIMSVIVDRGYVRKQGKQLVPTFMAFLAMEVLENNFSEFVELAFTRNMDDTLDEISEGKVDSKNYLQRFFIGSDDRPGLKTIVDSRKRAIPYPAFVVGDHPDTGEAILVRNGKDGNSFLQIGDGDNKRYANIPDDLAPAELNVARAIELFDQKSSPSETAGVDPITGRRLLVRNRQGYYLEAERTEEEIAAKEKPRWISVPPGVNPKDLTQDQIDFLCRLPRTIGKNPETGEEITFKIGKYGAYVECGVERRTIEDWRVGETMSVDAAVAALAQPKFGPRRSMPAAPLREFGSLEGSAGAVKVLAGRFGPYVTDGETNVTLPKARDPATITAEEATELLRVRREAGPRPKFKKTRGKTAKKTATASRAKKR